MEEFQKAVVEFRKAMDLEISPQPRTLSSEEAMLHIKMIQDEFNFEFIPAFLSQDLVEMYDAGIDVIVYVMGALTHAGFDIEPGFKEIMRSNMSKMDPKTGKATRAVANDPSGEPEGKILKPEGYSPPNLHPIINDTYRFGPSDDTVYRTTKTPITLGIGGPKIGEGNVTMDHNGSLMLDGLIFDMEVLPQIGGLSIYNPEEVPEEEVVALPYRETYPAVEFDDMVYDDNMKFLKDSGMLVKSGEAVIIKKEEDK